MSFIQSTSESLVKVMQRLDLVFDDGGHAFSFSSSSSLEEDDLTLAFFVDFFFEGVDLAGVPFFLAGVDFEGVDLAGVDFEGLAGVDFFDGVSFFAGVFLLGLAAGESTLGVGIITSSL